MPDIPEFRIDNLPLCPTKKYIIEVNRSPTKKYISNVLIPTYRTYTEASRHLIPTYKTYTRSPKNTVFDNFGADVVI
jgi:3-dehydroquinate dehydratase